MRDPTKEIDAIKTIHLALEPLEEDAKTRVLTYITSLLVPDGGFQDGRLRQVGATAKLDTAHDAHDEQAFQSFADLYAAATPKTNGERALVAGYWLQECQGLENFTGAAANKELTHLGHKLPNITDAIEQMKSQKPMLMLQIKKSGTSRQARKLYKVSGEGAKRVQEMVRG